MAEQAEDEKVALRRALQKLSQEEGVWREDLPDLLRGELRPLRAAWRISVNSEPDVIRRAVALNLRALVAQLLPRPARQLLSVEQRKAQYTLVVLVSLNVSSSSDLRTKSLSERRQWLAHSERGPIASAVKNSQRDLNHAIEQMAEILVGGTYTPASTEAEGYSVQAQLTEQRADTLLVQRDSGPGAATADNPSSQSVVERISRRVATEALAIHRLLAPRFAKVRRAVRKHIVWLVCAMALGFFLADSNGYLYGLAVSDPPWQAWPKPVLEFIDRNIVLYVAVLALLCGAVLPLSAFLKRRKVVAVVAVSIILILDSFFGLSLILSSRERAPLDHLTAVAQSWSLQHHLMFDGKPSEADPYTNICNEFTRKFPRMESSVVEQQLADVKWEELNRSQCFSGHGELVLRASDLPNSLPGSRAVSTASQTYAEVLVRPGAGTLWSNCQMLAVPSYDNSAYSKILIFGLEVLENEVPSYTPVISTLELMADPKIVARSAATIPTVDEGQRFVAMRRDGWLTFGVRREDSRFDFFLNDHLVVSYDWGDSKRPIHISLHARPTGNVYAVNECRFDDFKY